MQNCEIGFTNNKQDSIYQDITIHLIISYEIFMRLLTNIYLWYLPIIATHAGFRVPLLKQPMKTINIGTGRDW